MELTPEERKKIYEEEKARIEAREQLEKERGGTSQESSTSLRPNVAAFLCYLGAWITGIIFLVIEQKNKWVRFHAAQSLVTFGALWLAGAIFGWIPFSGHFFGAVIGILGFVLWIVLMVKAYNGERFRVPLAAELAEMIVAGSGKIPDFTPPPPSTPTSPPSPPSQSPPPPPAPPATGTAPLAAPPPPQAAPPPPPPAYAAPPITEERRPRKEYRHRELRITGYAFAIAWAVILLVAFNFFHQYIAYYTYNAASSSWSWKSFFTNDINVWLPVLNAALAVSIAGHIIMIFIDNIIVRRTIHTVITGVSLAAVLTLLVVYPFDFSTNVIPNATAGAATDVAVKAALIVIAVGVGIALLVRFIQTLTSIAGAMVKPSED